MKKNLMILASVIALSLSSRAGSNSLNSRMRRLPIISEPLFMNFIQTHDFEVKAIYLDYKWYSFKGKINSSSVYYDAGLNYFPEQEALTLALGFLEKEYNGKTTQLSKEVENLIPMEVTENGRQFGYTICIIWRPDANKWGITYGLAGQAVIDGKVIIISKK